jgi:ATP-dependent Clp protease adaptor protein ClpS
VSDPSSLPDTEIVTRPREREETKTRRVPPYNVILENDDFHSFEFVVETLMKVLRCDEQRAYVLTLQAHTSGRAVIWTGPKEVAELKCEQVRSVPEVRDSDGAQLGPLACTIEPAPGG